MTIDIYPASFFEEMRALDVRLHPNNPWNRPNIFCGPFPRFEGRDIIPNGLDHPYETSEALRIYQETSSQWARNVLALGCNGLFWHLAYKTLRRAGMPNQQWAARAPDLHAAAMTAVLDELSPKEGKPFDFGEFTPSEVWLDDGGASWAGGPEVLMRKEIVRIASNAMRRELYWQTKFAFHQLISDYEQLISA
jgi:hypothetical protein